MSTLVNRVSRTSAVTAPAPKSYRGKRGAPVRRVLTILLGLALAAAAWSAVVAFAGFPRQLFPSIPDIAQAGVTLAEQGYLLPDILASARRAVTGLALGAAAGLVLAVVTSQTTLGRALMEPVLRLFAPIPTIGLVPLAILWFGIGEGSKTTVVALGVFVPMWINSHAGLASTPADFLKVARCVGASRGHTLMRVVLPEAAPEMASGLRVGAAMAFVLIVVAEMTGTTSGLGFRIYQAQMFSQADRLIFCLVMLGLLGAACDQLIARLTTPLTRWSAQEQ